MASNSITANGSTDSMGVASGGEGVHLSLAGSFGGGTVAVENLVNGTFYPLRSDGDALTFSAPANVRLNVVSGDVLRLTTSGATAPVIDFNLAGAGLVR